MTTVPVAGTDRVGTVDTRPAGQHSGDDGALRARQLPFATWVAVFAVAGLGIRLMNVYWWRPTTDRPGYHGYRLWGDAFYYHHQANALADGKLFVNPLRYVFDGVEVASAGHPPLYTLYLSFWSFLGVDSVTAHRVVSGLLGVATIVIVAYVGRRVAGNAAGLIAAAIVAVYPFMWINDGMLMSESLAVLMGALVLAASYAFVAQPDGGRAMLLGLACGGTALTRSETVLLLPLLVVPLALLARGHPWSRRVRLAAAGCGVAVLVMAPWIGYNLARFENPVFLSTGIGQTLQASACDETFYGSLVGYYTNCYTIPRSADSLDESERDALPREYALEYLREHATRVPVVAAARVGRLWGVFKPGQTTAKEWNLEGRGRVPSWMSLFFFYAMVPFAIVGLVVMRRRQIGVLPVVVPLVIATLAAAMTFGLPRYRAPAEAGLVLVTAVGIAAAWTAWRGLRRSRAGSSA